VAGHPGDRPISSASSAGASSAFFDAFHEADVVAACVAAAGAVLALVLLPAHPALRGDDPSLTPVTTVAAEG
jgi:hypothetical protein